MSEDVFVMALKADLKSDQALAALTEIKVDIKSLRDENSAQHLEARRNMEKSISLVQSRIDRAAWAVVSLAVAAVGSVSYLFLQKL
jgi:hypothetical protein